MARWSGCLALGAPADVVDNRAARWLLAGGGLAATAGTALLVAGLVY